MAAALPRALVGACWWRRPRSARCSKARGFRNIADWSRGVDTELFTPARHRFAELPRPVFLFVGTRRRGEEPARHSSASTCRARRSSWATGRRGSSSRRAIPTRSSWAPRRGAELASYYQRADVFVFPSRTDTFGLVLVEAMACGTPVAAFPVRGPIDVVTDPAAGVLDEDLGAAALAALALDRDEGGALRAALFVGALHAAVRLAASCRPARAEATLAQAA